MSKEASNPLQSAYEQVASRFGDVNERELWRVMMRELLRDEGGPEGCLEYLGAERSRIVQRVRDTIGRLNQHDSE